MSDHEITEPDPDEREASEPDEREPTEPDEPERVPRESPGNPWAKTSSGDADEIVDDEE